MVRFRCCRLYPDRLATERLLNLAASFKDFVKTMCAHYSHRRLLPTRIKARPAAHTNDDQLAGRRPPASARLGNEMDKQLSRYLDLLRIVAALLVLFAHLTDPIITDGAIRGPNQIGYSAVMIFFVLSGYVISYVAAEREFNLVDFAISRISRVYSVVIPAIALTIFVDVLFLCVTPSINGNELLAEIPIYQYNKFPQYLILTMLFGNQIWGLKEPAFSNGVYWSMCFEVYYYITFSLL